MFFHEKTVCRFHQECDIYIGEISNQCHFCGIGVMGEIHLYNLCENMILTNYILKGNIFSK